MATAELGRALAEMIRQDKVAFVCCSANNLGEDIRNLVAHSHYYRVPGYRDLTPKQEQELLDNHYNRVTDTCIPEEEAFRRLEKERTVTAVQVEGLRFPIFMMSADIPLLESVLTGQVPPVASTEFLAPLDPMLWDRNLIEALWDYRYSWEIYTPVAKRKYGYYVLPMLCGDRFVGRIEPKADKKTKALTVRNVWFEPGVRQTKKLSALIDKAVQRLAKFNGCEVQRSFTAPSP
jgi:uncharacterized protein YcaQ